MGVVGVCYCWCVGGCNDYLCRFCVDHSSPSYAILKESRPIHLVACKRKRGGGICCGVDMGG